MTQLLCGDSNGGGAAKNKPAQFLSLSPSACLSILVLIIFALNINLTNMVEELVIISAIGPVNLQDKKVEMMVGYYMVIPYAVLCLVSVGVIYMYHHAAYTHMKEQQKTTEDAPKEIMMY